MNSILQKPTNFMRVAYIVILFFGIGLSSLSVHAQAPTITSFTPSKGSVGSLVTITGTNLSSATAITVGGVSAIPISNNGSTLVAMVMPGATTNVISVTTVSGTTNSVSNYTVTPSQASNKQQGFKTTETGNIGVAGLGSSVSISADGNTAIVGGPSDNTSQGAAWIYTRSSGFVWTQQGNKLVGTGNTGAAQQGSSVAISADGNTVIFGGSADNTNQGAAWVYTRTGGVWTQQGNKLVGTGNTGAAHQGNSVSMSADGNTVIVGGYSDNTNQGAAWIFTRGNGVWTQQGNKIVGTGNIGAAYQGKSVGISADGNTAIIGGYLDNTNQGAAWIYTRSGGVWTQQGNKIVGTGNIGAANQGSSVSISADGNTAIVGGYSDNSVLGATWIFTRSSGVWSQQGNKLVGTGAVTSGFGVRQGSSVGISADGNTAIIGSYADNSNQGAAWEFTRSAGVWSQIGNKLVGTGGGGSPTQGSSVCMSADGGTAIVGGPADNVNNGAFWVYSSGAPIISSFAPSSGSVGSLVTISGTNFNTLTSLTIGGVSAIPISINSSSIINTIVALVMPGASSGAITVTNSDGTANGSSNFTVSPSQLPIAQQGNKLVGTGNTGAAQQGYAVSISADGNTAIVGGNQNQSNYGASWIYSRTGNVWAQQATLVGTGVVGSAQQGCAVSISADGNTAIVGGLADNGSIGAAWIFTRNGIVWTQQGSKLVGTGNIGASQQGFSVSISSDGNSAIVGGYADNANQGAAWIYTRSAGVWTQKGSKLVGTGNTGAAQQGCAVSISADGNTAIVGGYADNSNQGTAWIYTLNGGNWSQQGSKLVGTGNIGAAKQGSSVSISADGSKVIVGGNLDNTNQGAAWIFSRSGGVWAQQGSKLVGTGNIGAAQQGTSVCISADGNTAIVGGYADNNNQGAAWVYSLNGGVWTQQGNKLAGKGSAGSAYFGKSLCMSADGNNAIFGGIGDNSSQGAAWVFAMPNLPTINSFAPSSGPVGTIVSITGTYLDNLTTVNLGGVSAIPVSNDGSTLLAMVMPGSLSGAVSVTTIGGTAAAVGSFIITSSQAPDTQIGNNLVGTGNIGASEQGWSICMSADGNTVIVGGPSDNTNQGAAWIYSRSGGVWLQQGNKLVGNGNTGIARQGYSVGISADGNTAIIGGYADNTNQGAAWIFTRSSGVWSQQGNKLVGTGNTGAAQQGFSVSITADGNTAIVGGSTDNGSIGAVWIYTRSGGVWTQQGNKLVGSGTVGATNMGSSVSISADGTTIIAGGNADNSNQGAVWIFLNSGGTWSQQGNKLIGTGNTGAAMQGISVSISADGNTAIVGGSADNGSIGASWIYTRSGGVWTQQGNKLVGTGSIGAAGQGRSVSISADGNTAIIGGPFDNTNQGAVWTFTLNSGVWSQHGNKLVGTGNTGAAKQGFSVCLNAIGNKAFVGGFQNNTSIGASWVFSFVNQPSISSFSPSSGSVGTLLTITGFDLDNLTSVTLGGIAAIPISNDGKTLVAMVMPGTVEGSISVSTLGGTGNSINSFTVLPSMQPSIQQGNKLVGTGNTGAANQGNALSISADGNTAIVGGNADNTNQGAVWIYTRSGSTWTQQGNKLVGTGNTGAAQQGYSVAISADGNTVIFGGSADNTNQGAAWVYTRTGGVWTQQGNKLVGTGNTGAAYQGTAVSISADGNTAIVGGYADNTNQGAAWIFTRSGGIWTQQGNKLVGTGNAGAANQGQSVRISADGNTVIVGGSSDNTSQGAAWVYTRTGGVWTQQGNKLVGTGNIGAAYQGASVGISADGNSVIIGGYADNNYQGAAWIFTRSGGIWTQQGNKLVGTFNIGAAYQGIVVGISADGNTAIIGGFLDNTSQGAAWVYKRSGGSWTQQGKLVGTGNTGSARQGCSVSISADGKTTIFGGSNDNTSQGAAWVFVAPIINTPTISSFSPSFGSIGTLVTISGTNLNNLGTLTIGGIAAIPITNNGSTLVAMVMPGATTGSISVITPGGKVFGSGNFTIIPSLAPITQQGNKLVGTGNTGAAQQGYSVSVSADGNTAIVGGYTDNTNQGAAWIYTRSGGIWTQQGSKLLGTGNTGAARQGYAVSISADGNTAIVGAPANASGQGAAWVFTRSNGIWTQQSMLVPTGSIGNPQLGTAVSMSADGNTAILGGPFDNSNLGAVWIFTRSGSTWTQKGNKLVGTGNFYATSQQGTAVSMSADGNTAIVGGDQRFSSWIFTYSGGSWVQQGNKVVGGYSVSISADGNTIILGYPTDNTNQGAAYIYTRSGGVWTQQGNKLVGTGNIGAASQGSSVSISADGNTAIVCGNADNTNQGAAWVYTRSGGVWTQQGNKIVGTGNTGAANQGGSLSISADGNTALVGGNTDNSNQGAAWVYKITLSNNADLNALSISSGTLSPVFVSSTSAYTASTSATSITVTPTKADANATIQARVNGGTFAAVTSGNATNSLTLNIGSNTIDVLVTAQDGNTTKTYTITVTRTASSNADLSDLVLSSGTLSPSFASGTISYTANVSNATSNITVTPTRSDANASITVNGTAVTSGSVSGAIALSVGTNTISVVVTAQNASTKTYTISITREASSNADLSAFTLSSGTFSPSFAASTTSYTASVSNATSSITVTPTRSDANASIQVRVNGGTYVTVVSGVVSGSLPLNVGNNTIDVSVTAQDGTTIKTYTITVSRCAPSSSTTNLSICSNALPYSWNGLTFNSAGSQTKTDLINSLGCDSSATLNLTITTPSYSSTSISSCNNYTWNGVNYTTSGAKTYTTTNSQGCDSVATLNLTITTPSYSSTSVSSCNNYTWNGVNYTTSGAKTFTTTNSQGCDSVATLNLTITTPSYSSTSVSSCNNYTWNGVNYTTSGVKTYTTTNSQGCDSIATLNLTITSPSYSSYNITINANQLPYSWNGLTFNTAGTQTANLLNAAGCDSAATLTLSVTASTVAFNLKAMLQGLYLGNGKMIATPFNADGVSPMNIADTITVELRANTTPFNVVHTIKSLLDTGGNATITFPSSVNGNSYYIVVGHRNSIAAWSANPVTFSATTNYDFTDAITKAFGSNMADDGTGVFMLFSGDINQDGSVDFNDYPDLDISSNNGDIGYFDTDLNGDASVDFNDYPILDINSNNGIISITP